MLGLLQDLGMLWIPVVIHAGRNDSDPLAMSPATHAARSNLALPCNGQADPELGLCSMQYTVLDFTGNTVKGQQ